MKKDADALYAAEHYLSGVIARHALGPDTICLIIAHEDVVSALIAGTKQSTQAREDQRERCGDLIAIATPGHSSVQRLVLGSVTERVLHTAMVPLLIVRPLAGLADAVLRDS